MVLLTREADCVVERCAVSIQSSFSVDLNLEKEITFVRHLWLITAAMSVVGIAMVFGGVAAGMGPVVLICGVLLSWSAIVKAIVLRIWRATLESPPVPEPVDAGTRTGPALSQLS